MISPLRAETIDLTKEVWRFRLGDPEGAERCGFPDLAWDRVSLPHTWNALDAQDGKNRPSPLHDSGYRRTPAWYRGIVKIPKTYKGQRTFLRCDGASLVKDIHVNGVHAGRHEGAFTAFCFEITDHVTPGEEAILAIRVDNSPDPHGKGPHPELEAGRKTVDIAPLRGDFNLYGGIYRGVQLITKPPLCISPIHFASPGVYVTTPEVSRSKAVVRVETIISDPGTPPPSATLTAVLSDADGTEVARQERRIAPKDGAREAVEIEVSAPRLWKGIPDPHLYSLQVTLKPDGGGAADSVAQKVGIRSLKFDREKGFVLNGEPIKLRGVNRHQDWQDRGWAIGREEHETDFAMIRELGANAVRLAHYPQDPYVLELCDRLGLVVFMEIPLVGWINPDPAFADNVKSQLREMIHQYHNHPSIPMWGLWNELMHRCPENMASPVPLVRELQALAREADPSRPTVAAANDSSDKALGLRDITDLIAWNVYPGWYEETSPDDMAAEIQKKRAVDGRPLIGISEYGAGGSIRQHEDWAQLKQPAPRSPWHPEEYQAYVHERQWNGIATSAGVWGSFIWNMFDFAADHRDEGDRPGINDKGLVTHDRQTRKDAFYFYKATWTEEPVVHITSRRFSPRPAGPATLKVYSNAGEVRLSVDGKDLGTGKRDGVIHLFPGTELLPGKVKVLATGKFAKGRGAVSDSFELEIK